MSNLNKLRKLLPRERRLLVQSALLLPIIHFALILLGYSHLHRWMERLAPWKPTEPSVSDEERIQRAREIARIVSIAARHGVYRATCLRRSLLVWWLLHREGIWTNVCFGVRMFEGKLEAHAWVEHNGVIVNDAPTIRAQYQPLHNMLPATGRGL